MKSFRTVSLVAFCLSLPPKTRGVVGGFQAQQVPLQQR